MPGNCHLISRLERVQTRIKKKNVLPDILQNRRTMRRSKRIEEFLDELGLQIYTKRFKNYGVDEATDIESLDAKSFEALEVSQETQEMIQRYVIKTLDRFQYTYN